LKKNFPKVSGKNLGGIYGGKKKNKPEIGKELKIFLEEPND